MLLVMTIEPVNVSSLVKADTLRGEDKKSL